LFELGKARAERGPGFLTVALIFVAGRLISRVVSGLFERVEKGWPLFRLDSIPRGRRDASSWCSSGFSFSPPPIRTFSGLGTKRSGHQRFRGAHGSLGGVGLVNQVMSGLMVVYSRSLRIGDFVRIGDQEGVVSEIGTLFRPLVTLAREVTVPNAVLAGTTSPTSPSAGEDGAVIRTTVTIGYDAPCGRCTPFSSSRPTARRDCEEPEAPGPSAGALGLLRQYQLLPTWRESKVGSGALRAHAQIQDAFNEIQGQIMSPHFEGQPPQKVYVAPEGWNPAPAKEPASGSS
jgi:hypothetical protein